MGEKVAVIAFWDKPGGSCYANLFCANAEQMIEFIDDNENFAEIVKNALKEKIGQTEPVDEGNNDCLDRFEKFLRKSKEGRNEHD